MRNNVNNVMRIKGQYLFKKNIIVFEQGELKVP